MTGGGDSRHFKEIDDHFIKLLKKNKSLLFIPLAGPKRSWKSGLRRVQETFSSIELDQIEMCDDLSELSWDYLKGFGAVYFDGGNTFQLMSKIRETHTFEILHQFLHHGGIINGDSAGAIVLGSHIETAHFGHLGDKNSHGVVSYQGLNFLGNWAVHCHYKKSENKEIISFVEEYGFPVMALDEKAAVSINGRNLLVIGKKPVYLFTPKGIRSIYPNEKARL